MPYRFATQNIDYTDFASGRVLYAAPGHPALPVRLTSEIFQRCLAFRPDDRPVNVYDPCCGSAYHLATLGFLHGDQIGSICGSDIDPQILAVAEQNLGLLTAEGLNRRAAKIDAMAAEFQKASHIEAAASAAVLQIHLPTTPISTKLFTADAINPQAIAPQLANTLVDIILADVPYGLHSSWRTDQPTETDNSGMLFKMLGSLQTVTQPDTVVAIIADKKQKARHPGYRRLDQFQIGKRRMTLLRPV